MSPKNSVVKLTLAPSEIEGIDRAVESGLGSCRADVCRKAVILYLDKQEPPAATA
ncbi:hypothetical protein SDC9_103468 [bioreactor metagenome]|uniref:Uncharacterized protein n=1 Tax=bioreactor metagenome TaxID=1076179 RepID=A0A645AU95_9ZZZZ